MAVAWQFPTTEITRDCPKAHLLTILWRILVSRRRLMPLLAHRLSLGNPPVKSPAWTRKPLLFRTPIFVPKGHAADRLREFFVTEAKPYSLVAMDEACRLR